MERCTVDVVTASIEQLSRIIGNVAAPAFLLGAVASFRRLAPRASGEVKALNASSSPASWGGLSMPSTANVHYTPHRAPADLVFGGSGHADTSNSCPTRPASVGDFCGHGLLRALRNLVDRTCLRRVPITGELAPHAFDILVLEITREQRLALYQ